MKLLQTLDPVNFAFVMATGIISISLNIYGWLWLSQFILLIGALAYVWLVLLFVIRSFAFPQLMWQGSTNVEILFKWFTFSAGSSALAVRFCLAGCNETSIILGIVGSGTCVFLIYFTFCRLLFHQKTSLESVSPYWLLQAIACNYVGIIITTFWQHKLIDNTLYLVVAFCFWSFGVIIYLLFMALNIFRMFFLPFEGKDLNPSYWTCMGAAAIAVVDGCKWVSVSHPPLFLDLVKPFVEGMSILLWGWATAWIPILCLMMFWKYLYFKMRIAYHPSLWAMVFPLGMYTAATDLLSQSIDLPTIQGIVPVSLWVSIIAWIAVASLGFITKSDAKT